MAIDSEVYLNSADRNDSSWLRTDRIFDFDRFEEFEPQALWPSAERPPDPTAWRIRTLMERYLSENHRTALEEKYFLRKSTAAMARDRGCTERAVRGLLERARRNLIAAIAEHGAEVQEVPEEEL